MEPGLAVQALMPAIQEWRKENVRSRLTCSTERVPGQPGQLTENLLQTNKDMGDGRLSG